MRYLFSLILIFVLLSCGNNKEEAEEPEFLMADDSTYGYVSFENTNSISADSLVAVLNINQEFEGTVSGEAVKVCQSEGCWLTMQTEKKSILVLFKDKFSIPKDTYGKQVLIHGKGMNKEYTEDRKDSDFDIIYFADAVQVR